MMIPRKFRSPAGRQFAVAARMEPAGYYQILKGGKVVGKLWKSDKYGPEKPWQVTTRELYWSGGGELPLGLGFDGGPHRTARGALAEFGRIADDVLDYREGKPVRSIYSKKGLYQKGR